MRPPVLAVVLAACVVGCAQLMPNEPSRLLGSSSKPRPLEELVRTIDHDPEFHGELTPSVRKLIDIGDPAIPWMLGLMLLNGPNDDVTRLHAETVLYGITHKKLGWVRGQGWTNATGSARAHALSASLGNLSARAPLEERERAVGLWREWYAKGCPLPDG